eukprot:scaffold2243_cov165-Amphora_coffeaeformis.AAC.16
MADADTTATTTTTVGGEPITELLEPANDALAADGTEKETLEQVTEKAKAMDTTTEADAKEEDAVKKTPPKAPTETSSPKKEEESDSKQEAKVDEDTKATMHRPIKRARTAYFIFAEDKRPQLQKEHPGEGVAVIAKALGQLWSTLPDEEKQVYQQKAAAERTRVQEELQARQAAGLIPEPATASNAPVDPNALVFPLGRVRKIAKLDPEIRGLSKEGLLAITKAAECVLAKLGQESVTVANMQNRRKLLPEDVVMVCQTRSAFSFLKDDLQDLVAEQKEEHAKPSSSSDAGKKRKADATSQSNKLTSYFTVKSSDS